MRNHLALQRGLIYPLPLAVVFVALTTRVTASDLLERLSLVCFGLYQKIAPGEPGDAPIRVVDIDDASLHKIGQWPWPRTIVAQLMAFWNAPLDDPDHVKNAVQAAQAMRSKLVELNRLWQAEAAYRVFLPVRIGIGINTGECVVGNFGSLQQLRLLTAGRSGESRFAAGRPR